MTGKAGEIRTIEAITRTVTDLEAAGQFYRDALDFTVEDAAVEASPAEAALLGLDSGRLIRQTLRLGEQRIVLLRFEPQGRAYPPYSTSTDLWFQHCAIVVGDMEQAYERVMEAGALPISHGGPQHLPANTGGVTAFKFRDPFGHPLELLHFPEGTGDPHWHEIPAPLFRGIDHTAIAVASRDASCRFYNDVLRFQIQESSHNRGPAQSRLDAVPADDVDVVALAPQAAPPHLELLAYRTGTRRPLASAEAADAAVSRTLATGDIRAVAARLETSGQTASVVRHGRWEDRDAIAFQDPDGHAWICRAPA